MGDKIDLSSLQRQRTKLPKKKAVCLNEGDFGKGELFALGQALRQLRLQRGSSLREIAEAINTSAAAIQRVESGDVNPSLVTVIRLAELYDRSVDQLVSSARSASQIKPFVTGALKPGALLSEGLAESFTPTQVIGLAAREERGDLAIQAPFFVYILEGQAIVTLSDGRVERLQSHDSLHAAEASLFTIENPMARPTKILCVQDTKPSTIEMREP